MNLQEAYMTMQNEFMKQVPVGSIVRITRKAEDNELGWNNVWNENKNKGMDTYVGFIGYIGEHPITNINRGIMIKFSDNNYFHFPFFVLEVIEKKKENIKVTEFKPFDRVLTRDADECVWRCDHFSHKKDDPDEFYPYVTVRSAFRYCIPYEGNEHLVGTTISPGA